MKEQKNMYKEEEIHLQQQKIQHHKMQQEEIHQEVHKEQEIQLDLHHQIIIVIQTQINQQQIQLKMMEASSQIKEQNN